MKTPDLTRVTRQSDDRPGRVGLHIPHLDSLVMRSTYNSAAIKLNTGDTTRVTLKCPDMALATHPGSPQFVSLHKHLSPVYDSSTPPVKLQPAPLSTQSVLWSPVKTAICNF